MNVKKFADLKNNTLFVKVSKNGKIVPAICEKIAPVAGTNCSEMPTDNDEGMCRGHAYFTFVADDCAVIECES